MRTGNLSGSDEKRMDTIRRTLFTSGPVEGDLISMMQVRVIRIQLLTFDSFRWPGWRHCDAFH